MATIVKTRQILGGKKFFMFGNVRLSNLLVTKEIAEEWLTQRNPKNRKMRPGVADRYGRDKTNGLWVPFVPVTICFDINALLGNGQHRLTGIAQSGIAEELLIAEWCSPEQIAMLDRGLPRSICDTAAFIGRPMNTRIAAIVRILGGWQHYSSDHEIFAGYDRHREETDWAIKHAPAEINGKRRQLSAPVLAVAARAYVARPLERDRIEGFLRVLGDGLVSNGNDDSAAVRLRDYLTTVKSNCGNDRRSIYSRTENALRAFLAREFVRRLSESSCEEFPFPWELGDNAEPNTVVPLRRNQMRLVKAARAKAPKKPS